MNIWTGEDYEILSVPLRVHPPGVVLVEYIMPGTENRHSRSWPIVDAPEIAPGSYRQAVNKILFSLDADAVKLTLSGDLIVVDPS